MQAARSGGNTWLMDVDLGLKSMRGRTVTVIGIALLAAGAGLLIAGGLSYERLQSFGTLIRRADDVTPERFARYRHVCWFFAAVCASFACVLRLRGRSFQSACTSTLAASQPTAGEPLSRERLLRLIVIVGLALRVQRLFDPVAYDEAYTYLNFASRPWYEAIGDYNSTNNHLLNTLLMHVSTRVFGPQEWALRWHVLLAGSVLPIAVYVWGREWLGRPVGLIAAAAAAVSPMLITYSADARGYMLVSLAAIAFDLSLGRLAHSAAPGEPRGSSPRPIGGDMLNRRAWWLAWGALVFGLCSMPLMVYAALGSTAWFVVTPLVERRGLHCAADRLRTLAGIGLMALPAVAAFYAPAYIFRGLMFLDDPIVRAAEAAGFGGALGAAWLHAFEWWTAGGIPGWMWGIPAVIGVVVMPSNAARIRWCAPFLVVLLLNILQHVAPPPRIYMHLAPWVYLAAAMGLLRPFSRARATVLGNGVGVAIIVVLCGSTYAVFRPVLFHETERAGYVSVPAAISAVQAAIRRHPEEASVLLAPLPCDLPSIFYMRRAGPEIRVNVRPQPGDRVFLIARPQETPAQVLATPLLGMPELAPQFEPWQRIAGFQTLTLHMSRVRTPDE